MVKSPSHNDTGRVVRRLLGLSWRYRKRALQVFCFQVVLLAMTLGGVGLTGVAIDIIRHSFDPSAPVPRWPLGLQPPPSFTAMEALGLLGVSVVLMALVRGAVHFAYSLGVGKLVHAQIVPTLRAELYRKLQRLSFRFFDAHPSGAIINRVTRDVQMLRSFVDGVVIQGAVLLLALGVFLSYMLATHVRLTLVSMALTPLLYVVTVLFSRWARPAYQENRRLADDMVKSVAEGVEGIVVTKVFGREREAYDGFVTKNQALRDQQRAIFANVSRFVPGVDLLNHLSIVVLMGYGALLVKKQEITLGDLVVFAGLLQQFATRASSMATIVNTLQQSLIGARRVFEVLDTPLEVQTPERPEPFPPTRGAIEFRDVHFAYHEGMPTLNGVSLRVEPGECVGVLGATGSGKSTLLSLIPRFYDATQGCVYVDGSDVRRLDLDELRRRIGIVFQEAMLFRGTVRENIAFGYPEASEVAIERAAKKAGADEFIRRLPRGYDTVVEEGSVNLSGGQRQRLSIARALLLEPPVLILDDPTTAIDAQTELAVLEAVDNAIVGRTTFLVSNRISTLTRADRIVVLESGQISDIGSHEELMRRGGLYAKTAELQGVPRLRSDRREGTGVSP